MKVSGGANVADLLLLLFLLLGAGLPANAGEITGPVLNETDGVYHYAGIGFTANTNATLVSFVFQNENLADSITLYSASGAVLGAVATPAGNPSYMVSVDWALAEGQQYYLLQTTVSNADYTEYGVSPPADAEITLTDIGIFSFTPPSVGLDTTGNDYWAAFNDIVTGPAQSVAEPDAISLAGAALVLLGLARRRVTAGPGPRL